MMKNKGNSRIEQEINEILERKDLGDLGQPSDELQGRRYKPSRRKLQFGEAQSMLRRVPSGILWLVGVFGFAILAILVADWSRNLALLFGILSILVVFSPLYFWSRPTPIGPPQKEWRGRVVQMPPRQEGPLGKIKYKLWELRNRSR
jgi:cytochrome b subunit of formate dehydrogenase